MTNPILKDAKTAENVSLIFHPADIHLPQEGHDWLLVKIQPESYGGFAERPYYALATYDWHTNLWRTKAGSIGIKHIVTEWAELPALEQTP